MLKLLAVCTIVLFLLSLLIHIILCNTSKKYVEWVMKDNQGDFMCDC